LTVLFQETRYIRLEVQHSTVNADVWQASLLPELADKLNADTERVSKFLFGDSKGSGGVIESHKALVKEWLTKEACLLSLQDKATPHQRGWHRTARIASSRLNFSAVRVGLISTQITAKQYSTQDHKTHHLNAKKAVV
jgi:hypothetical protein